MIVLELAAVAAFLLGCAYLGRALVARVRPRETGPWTVEHTFEAGARRVSLRRGDAREPVGHVAPDDPDYEDKFTRLMERARERAATLNGER